MRFTGRLPLSCSAATFEAPSLHNVHVIDLLTVSWISISLHKVRLYYGPHPVSEVQGIKH